MFLKTLQWRLVSIFVLVTMFLVIPIGLFMNQRLESWHYEEFKRGLEKGFENWSPGQEETVDEIVKDLQENNNVSQFFYIGENKSYTIIDRKTNEIYRSTDTGFDAAERDRFLNQLLASENFIAARAGRVGSVKRLLHQGGRDYFDYARPAGAYILYFRYYKEAWLPILNDFNSFIVTSLIISVMIALVFGYIMSKTITVPVERIMHKAESLAEGDFDQVLEVKSEDEIGKLTSTFNYMAQELKSTLAEISSEKNKIETILNYMTDGVIAFNLKGEVIHANPASRQILGLAEAGFTFREFTGQYGLDMALEDVIYLESLKGREQSLVVNNRYIRTYFAVFTDEQKHPEGVIMVLQDITEQQKLDDARREFVANVSHELRTPLTSIKSYAESLLDGALEDRETAERFLSVIDSEADRMTRLVRDLLQLSRLDNRQMQLKLESLSLVDLVRESVEMVRLEAQAKDQKLESFVIGEVPDIMADFDRLQQVVLNVLGNAVKYTPRSGSVTVYVGRIYSDVYVKVVDTGIGIPEKDLSRIFERFYRVDKARSREMGGTGLGLAIAREITEALGGSITAVSELDKGTEMTVRLPVGNHAENEGTEELQAQGA